MESSQFIQNVQDRFGSSLERWNWQNWNCQSLLFSDFIFFPCFFGYLSFFSFWHDTIKYFLTRHHPDWFYIHFSREPGSLDDHANSYIWRATAETESKQKIALHLLLQCEWCAHNVRLSDPYRHITFNRIVCHTLLISLVFMCCAMNFSCAMNLSCGLKILISAYVRSTVR